MAIPTWLKQLRRQEIVNVVNQNPTTRNNLILGLPKQQVFDQVICGGQAEFDTPSELKIGLQFSVTISADAAEGLAMELRQILQELGVGESVRVE